MSSTSRRRCARTKLFHAILLGVTALGAAAPTSAQMVTSGKYVAIGEPDELQPGANASADGVAIGSESSAGVESVAIGTGTTANGQGAVAIGDAAAASTANSVAIGMQSTASGAGATVVGYQAAGADNAVAFGYNAKATGRSSIAMGMNSVASFNSAISIGSGAQATDVNTTAIGGSSYARYQGATAMGFDARAMMMGASAFGWQSRANDQYGVAAGWSAVATGNGSIAIGANARATVGDSVAIGWNSQANRSWTVSFGSLTQKRQLANVEAGTDSYDAVNVFQLSNLQTTVNGQINGLDTRLNALEADSAGGYLAFGATTGLDAAASGAEAVAVGARSAATGDSSVAIGTGSIAERDYTVSFGGNGTRRTLSNVAAGVEDDDAVTVVQLRQAGLIDSAGSILEAVTYDNAPGNLITLKPSTTITNVNAGGVYEYSTDAMNGHQMWLLQRDVESSVLNLWDGVDDVASEQYDRFVAMGLLDDNTGQLNRAVSYDYGSAEGTITLQGYFGTKLTNLTPGDVTVSSTDAVNGGQLFAVQSHLNGVAEMTDMLWDMSVDTDKNIEAAFVGTGLLDADTLEWRTAVTYDYGANGAVLSLAGAAGTRITNVAPGNIALGSVDAVNGAQVAAIRDSLQGQLDGIDTRVDSIETGGGSGGSGVDPADFTQLQTDVTGIESRLSNTESTLTASGLVDGSGNVQTAATYDSGSANAVMTFLGAGGTVLDNVGAGRIEAGSRQAVNGDQINSLRAELRGEISGLDSRVTGLESGGTGGTGDPTQITNLQTQINSLDGRMGSVEGGLVNVGDRVERLETSGGASGPIQAPSTDDKPAPSATGDGAIAAGSGAKATADNTVALGTDSVADRANTVSVGAAGSERQVTNVAAGERETDAVNLAQLNEALDAANARVEERVNDVWTQLNHRVDEASRQANRGIASAAALVSNMPYIPGTTTMNAGVANYRGENAMGIGVSRWSDSGRFNLNAGVSQAEGDSAIVRVGVGFVFD